MRKGKVNFITRTTYRFLASVQLALTLLIAILACCIAGVTLFRGERAGALIFNTLWFNGLLVLLVVNVAFCFFSRIWGRRISLISMGMILFHLSFVAMLGGVIYNNLFYFQGSLRVTEGETLSNRELESYDIVEYGRFFNPGLLQGETTLIKVHPGYVVDGADKYVAYEIAIGKSQAKKNGFIYVTKYLEYKGFRYYRDKEGYSVLAILYDDRGREQYGLHIPLQSFQQKEGVYLYSTGTRSAPGSIPFPQEPARPLINLQIVYVPTALKERAGDAVFRWWPETGEHKERATDETGEGKARIGEQYRAGNFALSVREIRYWVSMHVRYDPGHPIVLASLWVGLGGMVITFLGRIAKAGRKSVESC